MPSHARMLLQLYLKIRNHLFGGPAEMVFRTFQFLIDIWYSVWLEKKQIFRAKLL